ncbi:MAG: hypothetical protein R3C97_07415 [Geminicoccaceae bacterium]
MTPKLAQTSPPFIAMPGMMVQGYAGATTLGWPSSRRNARPREWNAMPVRGQTRPVPKLS